MLNPEFVAKSHEALTNKLRSVVMDDPLGHTKAINYMIFDELDTSVVFTSLIGTSSAHLEK